MHRRAGLALTLALFLAAVSPAVHATTVTPVTVEALAVRADAVLLVTPRASQSRWSGGLIVTDVDLEVQSVVRGREVVGAHVVLRVPGGVVDHLAQHVPGVPALAIGQPYLVFLSNVANMPGTYDLTHLTASVLPLAQSPVDGTVVVLPPAEGMTVGADTVVAASQTLMRPGGVALTDLVRALRAAGTP